ncbi:hypothetical protein C8J56DRAFT_936442 [Mycena floridula]|nr:hypothetical protein C8J56DRAFT_936442 [Mycena floridula]
MGNPEANNALRVPNFSRDRPNSNSFGDRHRMVSRYHFTEREIPPAIARHHSGSGSSFSLTLSPDSSTVSPHSSTFSPHSSSFPPNSSSSFPPDPGSSWSPERPTLNSTAERRSRGPISTGVRACCQCRNRKIRCDSTRPGCNNCARRGDICQYDATPKRRGPDKRPGTRHRSCKKRPIDGSAPPKRPKRQGPEQLGTGPERSGPGSGLVLGPGPLPGFDENRVVLRHPMSGKEAEVQGLPVDLGPTYPSRTPIVPSSSCEYETATWWTGFLLVYQLGHVTADLDYLFNDTGHWLAFIHIPSFLETIQNEETQRQVQPALILAGLALAHLMRSSETENSSGGRDRALWLRKSAQEKLEASWTAGWIDHRLAQAAFILALFESSAHPEHDLDRFVAAMVWLDDIIRHLSLTTIDAHDSDVSIFPARMVPCVDTGHFELASRCSCIPVDSQLDPRISHSYKLPWDCTWGPEEIRNEECRRLCWNALGLVASYTTQCAAFARKPPDLFLTDPSNFSLLFPGQVLDRIALNYRSAESHSPKESVWALYCRSMLLWCFCYRCRDDETCGLEDKSEFAQEGWNESQAILDSLDMHGCNLDTSIMYMTREYVSNIRMIITQVLRSLQDLDNSSPVLNRKQAEDWIHYQAQVVNRAKISIQYLLQPQAVNLVRRPFQVNWYLNQLAICLMLWRNDRSLVDALELAKSLLLTVDSMNALWPCQVNQEKGTMFRKQILEACRHCGVEPPA